MALARLLHQQADVLLLDEPTRGIDVGSKAEIYRLIGELAAAGQGDPGRQLVPARAVRDLRPDRRDVAGRAQRGPARRRSGPSTKSWKSRPGRAVQRHVDSRPTVDPAERATAWPQARPTIGRQLAETRLRGTLGWVWTVFGPFLGPGPDHVLFAVLTRESGTFLTLDNWRTIAVQTVIVGTAALGMTIIMIAGGIDLSVGSTVALVTVCIALVREEGRPAACPMSLREWKLVLPLAMVPGDRDRRSLRRDQRRA